MMKHILVFISMMWLALTSWGMGHDSYTVLVSLDGLRWDYAEAFDTPFFDRLAQQGVKAVITPSFPSKTFPNHYTLATGLVPDHHGIIANKFKIRNTGKVFSLSDSTMRGDPQYFGGDPLWLTAKRQGVRSATVYWVGSDVAIKGDHPNYWLSYDGELLTLEQRVDEIIRLLQMPEQERPHLVMAYFEEPDASGHSHGSRKSGETGSASGTHRSVAGKVSSNPVQRERHHVSRPGTFSGAVRRNISDIAAYTPADSNASAPLQIISKFIFHPVRCDKTVSRWR